MKRRDYLVVGDRRLILILEKIPKAYFRSLENS